MSIETKIWKLNGENAEELTDNGFDLEAHLEDILFNNFKVLSSDWMLIGRQVYTGFGYVDLLAMDRNGELIVLELKKDRTPRDVVAQLLDYGSWVQKLTDTGIADIFVAFQEKYLNIKDSASLDCKFEEYFGLKLPVALNSSHQLVVVSGSMDESSERIVDYLSEYHDVKINFVLVRNFVDSGSKYITKTWHADPFVSDEASKTSANSKWNGQYYVSFGEGQVRSWDDAVKFGFVSAGGGEWYSQTLSMLKKGDHIWVNIPRVGYVGKGTVRDLVVPASSFEVIVKGKNQKLSEQTLVAKDMFHDSKDPALCEYVVAVDWEICVDRDAAISEAGLFGNQNTVCRPVAAKWEHTVKRLESLLKKPKAKAA